MRHNMADHSSNSPVHCTSEIPEELLICGICQDKLRNPKQLKCLHTFCKDCIDSIRQGNDHDSTTGNSQQGERSESVCPVCNITFLSSDRCYGNDYFSNSLLRSLSLEDSNGTHVMCIKHSNKEINRYCSNCKDAVCETCWSTKHGGCSVNTLPQGIVELCREKENIARENLNAVKSNIENVCQDLLNKQCERASKKEEIGKQVSEYFSLLRNDAQRGLMEQEKKLLRQLDDSFSESSNTEMNKVAWCRSMLARIVNKEQYLDASSTNEYSPKTALSALQVCKELQAETSKTERLVEKFKPDRMIVNFTPKPEKMQELMNEEFAELVVRSEGSTLEDDNDGTEENESQLYDEDEPPPPYSLYDTTTNSDPFRYADYRNKFLGILPNEKSKGYVVGLAWIGDDRLVTVDRWNRTVKVFSVDGECTAVMLISDSEPWDIAHVRNPRRQTDINSPHYCFVTLPTTRSIRKIMIPVSGKMAITSNITTAVGYTCLAHNYKDKNLICGVCPPLGSPRVDVVAMNGTVLKCFAVDSLRKNLFSYPRSVDVVDDGNSFVVCDWNKNSLLFIRQDGFIQGCYRGTASLMLKDPVGTSVDPNGYIMVSDKKSNCIHIVKPGGDFIGEMDVNVRLQEPREINISAGSKPRMAVSYGPGFIEIFDLFNFDPSPPDVPSPSHRSRPSAPPPAEEFETQI